MVFSWDRSAAPVYIVVEKIRRMRKCTKICGISGKLLKQLIGLGALGLLAKAR
jgi:hypothetical protein